jgi:hypothetical protein
VLAGTVGANATESDFALARLQREWDAGRVIRLGGWARSTWAVATSGPPAWSGRRMANLSIAGYTNSGGTFRMAFVRFHPNGTLDTTFGTGGSTKLDFGGGAASWLTRWHSSLTGNWSRRVQHFTTACG